MWIRFVIAVGLLGCGGESSKDAPQVWHTGGVDSEAEVVKTTGCVRGQLRDFKNAAYANAVVRAVELEHCAVLDEESSFGDGSFCIENLPILENAELQVSFVERCTWAHALQVQPVAKGNCDQPASCLELATWFECEGNSISCQ